MQYEYACESAACAKAGEVVDVSKPVAEMERLEPCPSCAAPMKRLISRSSFALKGGCWARDLYGK